jgi:hypothetical protein
VPCVQWVFTSLDLLPLRGPSGFGSSIRQSTGTEIQGAPTTTRSRFPIADCLQKIVSCPDRPSPGLHCADERPAESQLREYLRRSLSRRKPVWHGEPFIHQGGRRRGSRGYFLSRSGLKGRHGAGAHYCVLGDVMSCPGASKHTIADWRCRKNRNPTLLGRRP